MKPSDVNLIVGAVIRTNYGTGPYEVISITTGCTCSDYVSELNGCPTEREPHLHLLCKDAIGKRRAHSYLGGYVIRDDDRVLNLTLGISNGRADEIFIEGFKEGAQTSFEF